VRVGDHEVGAAGQGGEEAAPEPVGVEHRDRAEDRVFRRQPHRGGDGVGLPPQLPGGARHALRVPGAAGRVGQQRVLVGRARLGRAPGVLLDQPGDLLVVVDDEPDVGVAVAELELGALELGVQRHHHRAELRDREEGGGERRAVGEQQRDAVAGADAARGQPAREPPDALPQLVGADPLVAEDQRRRWGADRIRR
jgi:hypothetical protein